MNYKKNTLPIVGLTALYSVALAIFPKIANANQSPTLQTSGEFQVAQLTNCRQVDVNTALNVRRQPNGQIIGTLESNQNVSIVGEPENGWVRISGPMEGYVFARYLNYCPGAQAPTPAQPLAQTTPNQQQGGTGMAAVTGNNCRQINAPNVPVRTQPGGDVIGMLEENQRVSILNEGADGWVPIDSPMNGFVTSANLAYCS